MRHVPSALILAATLVAAPLLTATVASAAVAPSLTSSVSSNAGHSVAPVQKSFAPSTQSASFDIYDRPEGAYLDRTCLFDISNVKDFKQGMQLTRCGGFQITSEDLAEKRTVPRSWGTWGSPPDTESATPEVVWPLGLTSFTISTEAPVTTFGIEAEPNPFEVHTISVSYYTGTLGTGDLIGTVTRDASGDSGAVLFAASSDQPFQSVVISSDVDFAFGQIRLEVA